MVLAWHVQHTPAWCSRRWRPLRWSVGLSFCLARAPHLGRDEAPVLPMGRTRAAGGGRRDAAQVGGRGERSFCRPIYPALSLPLVYLCLSVRPSARPSVSNVPLRIAAIHAGGRRLRSGMSTARSGKASTTRRSTSRTTTRTMRPSTRRRSPTSTSSSRASPATPAIHQLHVYVSHVIDSATHAAVLAPGTTSTLGSTCARGATGPTGACRWRTQRPACPAARGRTGC